jgi:hypothetical protein
MDETRKRQKAGESVRRGAPRGAGRARLAELKRQIQSGAYETPEKLDVALRRLLADLRRVGTGVGPSREDETDGERP